jgi:hypothetical protein
LGDGSEYDGSFPPGVWRIGYTTNFAPNGAFEVDNVCFWTRTLTKSELMDVRGQGCGASTSSLTHEYNFDKDRYTIPNLYNSVDGA